MCLNKLANNKLLGSCIIPLFFLIQVAYTQTVTIDLLDEYQNISGFGGANIPDWIGDMNEDQVDKAFGNAPGQMGLSILRIKVPNDEENFSQQVSAAARAKSQGAIIIASPWSPPASMKSNGSTVGGYLEPSSYGDFADYLLNFTDFMSNNGAPLYAISVQNEPDVTVSYESCDYTSTQMLNFVKEQGAKFDAVNLMVSESFNLDHSETDPILNDAEAEPLVDIICGHIYGSGLADYPLARSKGKEVWMTEHYTESENSGNDWPLALDLGTEIHACMEANFSTYIWWYIRRYYGLIDDAGNITKRGYIMSQYAKFVRPGYTRVGVATNSVSNVDVSAFKTDTSIVVVAVNRNNSSTEINFEIQNGSADTLTMYTTSGSKNVENGGIHIPTGGMFSAFLDGESITTFTSYTDNAGKVSNVVPVAVAGPDQTAIDEDNNGKESITLDGSASTDADGTITNYSWSQGDLQIAWGESPTLDFGTGIHTVVLTVTDDDGATDRDTVLITVELNSSINEAHFWFETECSQVGSNWNIIKDVDASNSGYTMVFPGLQSLGEASESSEDHIAITFNVTEAGIYTLWGRTRVPTADDDSFWIRMDNGNWVMWNNIVGGAAWLWDQIHDSNNSEEVVSYDLSEGNHTLTICYREDGAGLDKLYLTNIGQTPSGLGGDAEDCTVPDAIELSSSSGNTVNFFPNPAHETLTIETKEVTNQSNEVYLYNGYGMMVGIIMLENKTTIIDISDFPKGFYYLKMILENEEILVHKFIKM